jgi:hypothetical protein
MDQGKGNQEAFQAIRTILLEQWDPLMQPGSPTYEDEYDSYVPQVVDLGSAGKPADVAAYLVEIETERMGLKGDWERCKKAAEMVDEHFEKQVT